MCEAPSKNRIDTMMINGVVDYNIVLGSISDTSLVRARDTKPERLAMEIYDNVSIP